MKVLFVAPMFPWPLNLGTRKRLYHLLAGLTRRHRVTLVAIGAPNSSSNEGRFPLTDALDQVITVDPSTRECWPLPEPAVWTSAAQRLWGLVSSPWPGVVRYWHSPKLREVLSRLRCRETFDAVWVERTYIAEMVRSAGFRRVVVDIDDVESTILSRQLESLPWFHSKPLHYAELARLRCYERLLPRRFWRLAVCKEEDRQLFPGCHRRVYVVPNGTTADPISPAQGEQPGELLFLGVQAYLPNVDAVQFFVQSILPRVRQMHPEARFHIVGKDPPESIRSMHDGVRFLVHGEVPDVTPYYDRASVVIAPIRLGSGTRLKVLEALARGKAVVATSIAAEGLDLRPGVDLEIADSPESFAAACSALLADPGRRRRLGLAGRQKVLQRYDWRHIGELAANVLEN